MVPTIPHNTTWCQQCHTIPHGANNSTQYHMVPTIPHNDPITNTLGPMLVGVLCGVAAYTTNGASNWLIELKWEWTFALLHNGLWGLVSFPVFARTTFKYHSQSYYSKKKKKLQNGLWGLGRIAVVVIQNNLCVGYTATAASVSLLAPVACGSGIHHAH
ncbi:hypothetical protein T492DRAFT_843955 [Pavlovales sp. CCMP2436]|nr:hypothetical protein T492DRAFT_843955 [Pavlovales sp. CCMP2436]